MYMLNNDDISYLIIACRTYQHQTGSEYLWDKYEKLVDKLITYQEQNLYAEGMEHS